LIRLELRYTKIKSRLFQAARPI